MTRAASRDDETAERLSEALRALVSLVIRERSRDLSLSGASTLTTLERCGPRPLTQLALGEGVAQPSMTALVAQLEALALVERRRDPHDGRVALIALTREGERHLSNVRHAFSGRLQSLVSQLPPDEAASLVGALPALEHLVSLADQVAVGQERRGREGLRR